MVMGAVQVPPRISDLQGSLFLFSFAFLVGFILFVFRLVISFISVLCGGSADPAIFKVGGCACVIMCHNFACALCLDLN